MKQQVYDDPYGLDAWDQRRASRCFVTIVNSAQWIALTGERPPTSPPAARSYAEAGLPWFDYYEGDVAAVDGAEKFKEVVGVAKIAEQKGTPMSDNESIDPLRVIKLGNGGRRQVREGSFVE